MISRSNRCRAVWTTCFVTAFPQGELRNFRPHTCIIVWFVRVKAATNTYSGIHAGKEDPMLSRYQMPIMQVYFHPVSLGMEVVLHHLLNALPLLPLRVDPLRHSASVLEAFLRGNMDIETTYVSMAYWCRHTGFTRRRCHLERLVRIVSSTDVRLNQCHLTVQTMLKSDALK